MQISEENKILIEKIVQNNELYIGNEHLFEAFCREIARRTYLVISSKTQDETFDYLNSISDKIISDVISRENVSIEYKKMLQSSSSGIVSLKQIAEKEIHKFDNNVIDFRQKEDKTLSKIQDPLDYITNEQNSKATIQKILETLYLIHQKNPLKYYFQIFYLKYYAQKKQSDIAHDLNISQSELGKRFIEMLEELKYNGLNF